MLVVAMGAAMKLTVDSPSAETLDLMSDDALLQVLRLRGPTPPPSLDAGPEPDWKQLEREKRVLRLLPRVSR
jgi:hypothetical protein